MFSGNFDDDDDDSDENSEDDMEEKLDEMSRFDDTACDNIMISLHKLENMSNYNNINFYYEIYILMQPQLQDNELYKNELHLFDMELLQSKSETAYMVTKIIEMNRKFTETSLTKKLYISKENNIYYETTNSLIDDLQLLCFIYLLIGGEINYSILGNFEKSIRLLIDFLLNKYSIANGMEFISETKPYTLATLASIFPQLCCEFYANGMVESPLSIDILGVTISQKNTAIYCRQFPLVTSKCLFLNNTNIFPQLLWIAVQLFKYDDNEIYDNNLIYLWDYIKNALFTPSMPEEIKFDKCLSWELINENGQPASFWIRSRKVCLYLLDEEFSHEPYWGTIRHEIQCVCIPYDFEQ